MLSQDISARIEAVREHFELYDNWPPRDIPIRMNAWATILDVHGFIDGHLTYLLATNSNALAIPYLRRIEHIINIDRMKTREGEEPRINCITSEQGAVFYIEDMPCKATHMGRQGLLVATPKAKVFFFYLQAQRTEFSDVTENYTFGYQDKLRPSA